MWPIKLWRTINFKRQPDFVEVKNVKRKCALRVGEIWYYRFTQIWLSMLKSPYVKFVFQGLNYVSWPNSNLRSTFFIPSSLIPHPAHLFQLCQLNSLHQLWTLPAASASQTRRAPCSSCARAIRRKGHQHAFTERENILSLGNLNLVSTLQLGDPLRTRMRRRPAYGQEPIEQLNWGGENTQLTSVSFSLLQTNIKSTESIDSENTSPFKSWLRKRNEIKLDLKGIPKVSRHK